MGLEPLVRESLRESLAGRGYELLEARSCEEVLELYRRERPDVVLLEVAVAGHDGLATLQELRALDADASIILVDEFYDKEAAKRAMADGAFDYLVKPLDPFYMELCLMTKLVFTASAEESGW